MHLYDDGIRRCHSSPAISSGEIDESGQNSRRYDIERHQQNIYKLRLRRGLVVGNASVLVYCCVAEVSVRDTDRLHDTNESNNTFS